MQITSFKSYILYFVKEFIIVPEDDSGINSRSLKVRIDVGARGCELCLFRIISHYKFFV